MIWNDTSGRLGLVQDMEDICGLGATGITSQTATFQQFTRWANNWNKTGATIAIKTMDGWDFDDPNWSTYPSGTYTGDSTCRDYVFASSLKLLKIKKVGITYDGTNWANAEPIDSIDMEAIKADSNVDSHFSSSAPKYDPKGNAIDIYPMFTAAQVSAGAKVYIEFFREPKEFATTGTDSYEPGFASPFHKLISKGASYEYCTIYKPEVADRLRLDIWGNGGSVPGLLKELESWYNNRYPRKHKLSVKQQSNK